MYKKILLSVVAVILCIMSAGCCKYNVVVDVNEKGGADVKITILGVSSIQDDVNEQRSELKKKGFKIENEKSGKLRGFTAKASHNDFNELGNYSLFAVKNLKPKIAHFKNYIADRYIVNADVDLTDGESKKNIDEIREYKNYIDISFQFNFPFNTHIDVTNGKEDFTPEKKILKWNIDVTQNNKIIFIATDWHKDRIIALLIAGLVLAGISYRYKEKITGANPTSDTSNSNVYKIALVGAVVVCGFLLWQYMSIPSDINTAYAKRNITEVENQVQAPSKVAKKPDNKLDNKQETQATKGTKGDFPDSFKDRGVILEDQTFVYKEPIKSSKILTKLNKNDVVGIKEEFKGFYFIMTEDKTLGCVEIKDCMKIKK